MTPRRLVLSLLILLPYAVFGLAPTGLLTIPEVFRNHARAGDGTAIEFPQEGIVEVRKGAEWFEAAIRNERFDIDLRVRPSSDEVTGPARILTSSLDPAERNLTIGQDRDRLIVRMRRPGTDTNGMPAIRVRDVFEAGRWVDIRVTFDEDELQILVDDRLVEGVSVPRGALRSWSPDYEMALGNEITLDRPWFGSIQRANITAGAVKLDLLAVENHNNPIFVMRKFEHGYGQSTDIVINFLGFIPLGVLLALWLRPMRWPVFVLLILVMASISAGIEAVQLTLPARSPSYRDFGLNVLGGTAGLMLAILLVRRKRTRRLPAVPEGAD